MAAADITVGLGAFYARLEVFFLVLMVEWLIIVKRTQNQGFKKVY